MRKILAITLQYIGYRFVVNHPVTARKMQGNECNVEFWKKLRSAIVLLSKLFFIYICRNKDCHILRLI